MSADPPEMRIYSGVLRVRANNARLKRRNRDSLSVFVSEPVTSRNRVWGASHRGSAGAAESAS